MVVRLDGGSWGLKMGDWNPIMPILWHTCTPLPHWKVVTSLCLSPLLVYELISLSSFSTLLSTGFYRGLVATEDVEVVHAAYTRCSFSLPGSRVLSMCSRLLANLILYTAIKKKICNVHLSLKQFHSLIFN